MSKFRSLILIIGLLLIAVAAALLTVLVLYATGTIVTDPIELVYSVDSAEKVYDGTPLTAENYTLDSGKLLEGHTASVKVVGSQINAGTSESTLEVKITDKNGFDVTKEYAVKVNAGTLTVEKQDLAVVIPDSEAYYSGKEVYFDDFEITDGALATGHKIAGTNATLMNVGDTLPENIQPIVYDAFGTIVTDNYNLSVDVGEVKIVARPITVKPKDVTRIYDGTTVTATEYEITEGSLVAGQIAKVNIIKETGGAATAVNVSETRILIDEPNFKILAEDGVTEVTENYSVYCPTAFLKIEKRPISISTATQSFTYDGEEHFNDQINISGEFAPNQSLHLINSSKVKDVTAESVKNEIDYEILSGDVNVASNYAVSISYGTLSVTPLTLTVQTRSYEKVYDGETLGATIAGSGNYYTTSPKLPSKFTLTATVKDEVKSLKDVASGVYSLTDVIIKMNDAPCTDNFKITVEEGRYSITPKPVKLNLKDIANKTKYFYGSNEAITVNDALDETELTEYGLSATDFTLKLPEGGIENAGHYTYSVNFIKSDKKNYDLTVKDGSVDIAKRPVTLSGSATALSMMYNGLNGLYQPTPEELNLRIVGETYVVKDADFNVEFDVANGFQTIKVNSVQVTSGGKDITDNLEVNCTNVNVRVTVTARMLSPTYAPYTPRPDGNDYFYLPGYVTFPPLADGDSVVAFEVTMTDDFYCVDAGSLAISNSKGQDVSKYYVLNEDYYGQVITP